LIPEGARVARASALAAWRHGAPRLRGALILERRIRQYDSTDNRHSGAA
jgi:hypothetical protein